MAIEAGFYLGTSPIFEVSLLRAWASCGLLVASAGSGLRGLEKNTVGGDGCTARLMNGFACFGVEELPS